MAFRMATLTAKITYAAAGQQIKQHLNRCQGNRPRHQSIGWAKGTQHSGEATYSRRRPDGCLHIA